MVEKLHFGIVGCGVIGPIHAEAIASLPDAQLISVVDINPEKAYKLANKYGARVYTQLQHMLDKEPVDVVIISTPSGLHGELACQVMRSGRHVIVEELEKQKTPPPAFVKANVKKRQDDQKKPRQKRDPKHNHARRREEPTQIIEHLITACPVCSSRLGGVSVAAVGKWSSYHPRHASR